MLDKISILKNNIIEIHQSLRKTEIKKEISIYQEGLTPYGSYVFCIEQLHAKINILLMTLININDEKYKNNHDINIKNSELEEYNLKKTVISIHNDMNIFVKKIICLQKDIGVLTQDDIAQYEYDFFKQKLYYLVCLDILSMGRISKPTLNFLYAFDKNIKMKIINMINNKQDMLDFINSHFLNSYKVKSLYNDSHYSLSDIVSVVMGSKSPEFKLLKSLDYNLQIKD